IPACPPPSTSPLFPYTTLFRSVQLNGLTANHTAQVYLHGLPPLGRVPFAGRWPDLPCGGKVRALMTLVMATGGRSVTAWPSIPRSEEHTSELQSRSDLVCRLLL